MDYLLLPIRDFFEALFTIMPTLGNNMNNLIIIVSFIAMCIWIKAMFDYQPGEKPNR